MRLITVHLLLTSLSSFLFLFSFQPEEKLVINKTFFSSFRFLNNDFKFSLSLPPSFPSQLFFYTVPNEILTIFNLTSNKFLRHSSKRGWRQIAYHKRSVSSNMLFTRVYYPTSSVSPDNEPFERLHKPVEILTMQSVKTRPTYHAFLRQTVHREATVRSVQERNFPVYYS